VSMHELYALSKCGDLPIRAAICAQKSVSVNGQCARGKSGGRGAVNHTLSKPHKMMGSFSPVGVK
jgi:hypothetical protein